MMWRQRAINVGLSLASLVAFLGGFEWLLSSGALNDLSIHWIPPEYKALNERIIQPSVVRSGRHPYLFNGPIAGFRKSDRYRARIIVVGDSAFQREVARRLPPDLEVTAFTHEWMDLFTLNRLLIGTGGRPSRIILAQNLPTYWSTMRPDSWACCTASAKSDVSLRFGGKSMPGRNRGFFRVRSISATYSGNGPHKVTACAFSSSNRAIADPQPPSLSTATRMIALPPCQICFPCRARAGRYYCGAATQSGPPAV